eukprot:2028254-Amphidinium_carterae.1
MSSLPHRSWRVELPATIADWLPGLACCRGCFVDAEAVCWPAERRVVQPQALVIYYKAFSRWSAQRYGIFAGRGSVSVSRSA